MHIKLQVKSKAPIMSKNNFEELHGNNKSLFLSLECRIISSKGTSVSWLYLTGNLEVSMIDFCVCSMSENFKKRKKKINIFWLTNKLNNVSLGPDPFVAGQGTVVAIQDFHFFFVGPSNSYYYHRDWHKCIGRMDQKSFGFTHVFSHLSKVINNGYKNG